MAIARMRRAMFTRHANPWSAWSRWASTPLVLLPVWTGRRAHALMAAIWFALNPVIFPKINDERSLGDPRNARRRTLDQPQAPRRRGSPEHGDVSGRRRGSRGGAPPPGRLGRCRDRDADGVDVGLLAAMVRYLERHR